MKAVLASIKREWDKLILSGEKTIELRKSFPKKVELPFICYLYESKTGGGSGKVVAKIRIDECIEIKYPFVRENELELCRRVVEESRVAQVQISRYQKRKACYGWHISEVEELSTPKEITEFEKYGSNDEEPLRRAPQSWCYVEVNG